MSDIFGNTGGFLDWSLNDPIGMATTDATAGYPNGPAVNVNRPSVDTGGDSWASWFDRIVGGAVALRKTFGQDATLTAYPGTQQVGYAGQPATAMGSNMMPLLLVGGLLIAALFVLKS